MKISQWAKSAVAFTLVLHLGLLPCSSSFADNGGGGSSGTGGGGTGVACFDFPGDAIMARQLRANGSPLTRDLVNKIKSLFVTDYWEHIGDDFIAPLNNETDVTYINRILTGYLGVIAPSFLIKVENALQRVSLDQNKTVDDSGKLLQIEDTGPVAGSLGSTEYGHCALVQIVVRYAKTDSNGKIETLVDVDRELFNKLGLDHGVQNTTERIINQGALRLHEALYLLGYGLGQKTSEKVRTLTAGLLSLDSYNSFINIANQAISQSDSPTVLSQLGLQSLAVILFLYKSGFGEFPYIEDQNISAEKQNYRSAYQRLEGSLIEIGKLESLPIPEPTKSQFLAAGLAEFFSKSDEVESFIDVAELALIAGKITDFYTVLDPSQEDNKETKQVCGYNNDLLTSSQNDPSPNAILINVMLQNTKSYCQKKFSWSLW